MDRLLRSLVHRAARRGLGGDPLWLAVAAVAWLVRRERARDRRVVWSGRLRRGEGLLIHARGDDPGTG